MRPEASRVSISSSTTSVPRWAELADRGVGASEVFHFVDGEQQLGPDPEHGDYNSFLSFADPDGNGYLVQEVRRQGS